MNNKKGSKKKTLSLSTKTVIVLTTAFLTLAAVFIFTFYLFLDKNLNNYESNMKEVINSINNTNLSTKKLIKDKSINPELSKTELRNIIKELEKVEKTVKVINPEGKYKDAHKALLKGLGYNQLMYKQIIQILSNPQSNDLSSSLEDFNLYMTDCINQYCLFTINNTTLTLPDDTIEYLDKFQFYANDIIKIANQSEIKMSQTKEFVSKLDEVSVKFVPIKMDFSIYVKKARDKSITYSQAIDIITSNANKCDELKKELLSITVPTNCTDIHRSFSRILDDYSLFTEELISEINKEKSQVEENNTSLSDDAIKYIYSNSTNRYLALNDKFENFTEELKKFKTSSIN